MSQPLEELWVSLFTPDDTGMSALAAATPSPPAGVILCHQPLPPAPLSFVHSGSGHQCRRQLPGQPVLVRARGQRRKCLPSLCLSRLYTMQSAKSDTTDFVLMESLHNLLFLPSWLLTTVASCPW